MINLTLASVVHELRLEFITMSAFEPESEKRKPSLTSEGFISPRIEPVPSVEGLGSQWNTWLLDLSKSVQPLFKETVVFAIFILGDLLIIWLAGFAFTDIIQKYPIVGYLYDGIKIFSVLVIAIHYLGNCIIEINKDKNFISSEVFQKKVKRENKEHEKNLTSSKKQEIEGEER